MIRGSIEERSFLAFYLAQGRIVAVMGFDRGNEVMDAKPLVGAAAPVDADRLRDPEASISSLA